MDSIVLQNTLPEIFKNEVGLTSDVWLQNITFEKGKHYLIEANSGTGKSSLCSYLYGYRADFSGTILFDQSDIRKIRQSAWDDIRCCQLSFLFQELRLFPELTAFENIKLKSNLTEYKSDDQIREMFEILEISDKLDTSVSKMSWGQQQRVAIIRCLSQRFDFIILDEPISHLDDRNATIIAKLIETEVLQREAGIIVTSIGKHLPLNYDKKLAL